MENIININVNGQFISKAEKTPAAQAAETALL